MLLGHTCAGYWQNFWDQQEAVNRGKWFRGPYFQASRETTQGGLILPTLFNLIVKNAVRNWIVLTVEDKLVTHKGL